MEHNFQKDSCTIKEKMAKGMNPKPKRNQFLISLYNALSKKEYEDALCWDADGKAFILQNPEVIADKILVEEFSGMKFTSFIRQLSYYGFKRVSRRANVKVYCHEQFQRDRKDYLKQIKRNHKDIESTNKLVAENTFASKKEFEIQPSASDTFTQMQRKIDFLQAELEKMRSENLALRSCIKNLSNPSEEQQAVPFPIDFSQNNFQKMNNERAPTGFYQTFFNPQVEHVQTDDDGVVYPTNQSAFIEVYQPDCRVHRPNYVEKFVSDAADPRQYYPPTSNDDEENNFFKPFEEKNPEENFWRFQGFAENDL